MRRGSRGRTEGVPFNQGEAMSASAFPHSTPPVRGNVPAAVSDQEGRVLVLAPTGHDARLSAEFMTMAGMVVRCCAGMGELCREIALGCGALVLAEEALYAEAATDLIKALATQASWSDIPIAIITGGGDEAQGRLRQFRTAGPAGNVTLLERPFHPETLVRTVETALRARERQYQVRDLLQAQRASEKRLHTILESISDAFAALDEEWRFTYINAGYLRLVSPLFGSATELLGHTVWDKFPELLGTEVERLYRDAMSTQKPGSCEFFYQPLGLWLEIRAHPSPRTLSLYATDITQRTHAEKALRESESRYRTLMERAGEGIFVCDAEGRHLMV